MSDKTLARVHYYPKQYLRLQDFVDEQSYHLGRLRQHQIGHHTWGIVRGLELTLNADETGLLIQPGLAVDGYGRLLALDHAFGITAEDFLFRSSNELEVWLVYALQESDQPTTEYPGCAPAASAAAGSQTDGSGDQFYRWQEQPVVRLAVYHPENPTQPRQPEAVPRSDWDFSPTRTPPDSPLDDWPVYLGRAIRKQEKPQGPFTYSANLDGRPYAGLVGEIIAHPSGRAWVQVGSNGSPSDNIRFAVFFDGNQAGFSPRPPDNLDPYLKIEKGGQTTVCGPTTVKGDITVDQGAVEFGAGAAYTNGRPNRVYLIKPNPEDQASPQEQPKTEWRLELEKGGQFSVGIFSTQEKKYKDCLTISSNGEVTINGDLHVNGEITQTETAPAKASEQAKNLALSSWLAPILSRGPLTHEQYQQTVENLVSIDPAKLESKELIDSLSNLIPAEKRQLAQTLSAELIRRIFDTGSKEYQELMELLKNYQGRG